MLLTKPCVGVSSVVARSSSRHVPAYTRVPRRGFAASSSGQSSATDDEGDMKMALTSLAASMVGGVAMGGLGLGLDESLPQALQTLSSSLGWSYFLAWSISFYPQVIENWRRKSVDGLSADYLVYSIIGYTAYAAYTAALYFSPGVQAAYMTAHGGSAPDVQLTDFLFAGHALLVSLFTLYQCFLYGTGSSNSTTSNSNSSSQEQQQQQQQQQEGLATSRVCQFTAVGVIGAVAAYCGHIGTTCGVADCDAWLPLLYFLGTTKVTMTLIKYTPQALLNAKRQSTEGWQINNVLLDLAGGLLSFAQIGLNAYARSDLSVITGNPAKLGISAISIGFDLIFILQHYVLYGNQSSIRRGTQGSSSQDAAVPLLSSEGGASSKGGIPRLARRAAALVANAAKTGRGVRV